MGAMSDLIQVMSPEDIKKLTNSIASNPENFIVDEPKKMAIMYNNRYMYTKDGIVDIPVTDGPGIMDNIIHINNIVRNRVFNDSNISQSQLAADIGAYIVDSNKNVIIDSFRMMIENLLFVYKERVRSIVPGINIDEFEYIDNNYANDLIYNLSRTIDKIEYDTPIESIRNIIANIGVVTVNNIGSMVYNNIFNIIMKAVSKGYNNYDTSIFNDIDSVFCHMMGDMTFEVGVFAENMTSYIAYVLDDN